MTLYRLIVTLNTGINLANNIIKTPSLAKEKFKLIAIIITGIAIINKIGSITQSIILWILDSLILFINCSYKIFLLFYLFLNIYLI